MKVSTIRINEMETPLGMDEERPVFSWLFEDELHNETEGRFPDERFPGGLRGEPKGEFQKKAQILVGTAPGLCDLWDSGVLDTGRSIGIRYDGAQLKPMTRYYVTVRVCSQDEAWSEASGWFETGLMAGKKNCAGKMRGSDVWRGAQWIGAPEYALAADTLSAFVLESTFRIEEGGLAGLVFGANDPRLLDKYKNEMLLEGENAVLYLINIAAMPDSPATLEIWRYGYAPDDSREQPLYVLPLRDISTGEEVITPENMRDFHTLRIEVEGNGAYAFLDGHPVDESTRKTADGEIRSPRLLNPLGILDVTTYPKLCSIGYYAGADTAAFFADGIHVKNLRHPGNEIYTLDREGKRITGACMQVEDPSCHSVPMLRRRFNAGKAGTRLKSARLYASARGIYSCLLNGEWIDDVYFAPGASQFDHHLMYQTFDITDRLAPGENVLGCVLASGWWSDAFSFRIYNTNFWGDKPSFLGLLVLTYEDGTEETIATDPENWEYFGEGPVRYAGFFNGEYYDARLEENAKIFFTGGDPAQPDGQRAKLQRPERIKPVPIGEHKGIFEGACSWPAVNETEPVMTGHYQAPVRAVETFTAKTRTEPRPGVYLYDLGQEIAGVPVITFHEKAGQKVTIRYAEMLYPDLKRYGGLAGMMLQANLRDAASTDVYICSGRPGEVFSPRFTFHGYRYLEMTGAGNPPQPEEVKSLLLSSVQEITGSFTCSDPLVNRLVKNVRYSQYCNFISIPTDCPQRNERMGWAGDTQAFCRTANLQSSVKNFYLRNLQAMTDLQTEDGRLPCIAPFGGGFGGMTYESSLILIVKEMYAHYGDRDIIETYYPAMDAWMDAMAGIGLPGMPKVSFKAWLGDWLAPQPADEYLIFNAFHYRNAVYMAFFAGLLGKDAEKEKYEQLAARTKEYWNRMFADPDTGVTKKADGTICDVQGSYAIALDCDVFDDALKEKAYAHLARKTKEEGYTVGTGFFGTGPLNYMLSAGGYPDIAGKTITGTKCPGWLYPVTQGATTIWERWDSCTAENGFGENNAMNSFNHYSLGSVVGWLYENVLGIRRDGKHPGYSHFILQPETGTFRYAKGQIQTPHGIIKSGWERVPAENTGRTGRLSQKPGPEKSRDGSEETIVYTCYIPVNTSAELILGDCRMHLGSGRHTISIPAAVETKN